jgi:predicted metal-dependent HD superfamily phosphohydrolase
MWHNSRVSTTAYLIARWDTTLKRAEAQGASPSLIEEILGAYSGSGLYYHVRDHLRHMFEVYDRFFSEPSIALELTFWYHDFVYDPNERDNEVRSANIAQMRVERMLQVASPIGAQIRDLILFSQYTRPPETREEMILHDIDLAIFGESLDKFVKYEADIRLEYLFVELEAYRKGRASILKKFLQDSFYSTTEMRFSSYETLAQVNIRKSIEALEA